MTEPITFEDYILAGVQKSVRSDSSTKDWALARTRVLKNLRALGRSKIGLDEVICGICIVLRR